MAGSVPDRGPLLLAVNYAFVCTAVVANLLRCFVRIKMVKAFGVDDWLMALATVCFIIYTCFSNIGVHYGTGKHREDLSVKNFQIAKQQWLFCYIFYTWSMIFSKLSIGWFLLRITVKRIHTWIIFLGMFVSVICGLAFFFITIFRCRPISYFWDTTSQTGTCVNVEIVIALGILYSVFNILSDLVFALLPAFLVWGLQLNRKTKLALIPLLTMGCVASLAVVVRTPYMQRFRDEDFLWSNVEIALWSTVEQGLAITAGSLATLRPLFTLFLVRLGISSGPSNIRPSDYGRASPSASRALGSRRKLSRDELNGFGLNTLTETACGRGSITMKKSPVAAVRPDNESEVSLKRGESSEQHSIEDSTGMSIMISKSFIINEPGK